MTDLKRHIGQEHRRQEQFKADAVAERDRLLEVNAELLAALKHLKSETVHFSGAVTGAGVPTALGLALIQARAAIAKVTEVE